MAVEATGVAFVDLKPLLKDLTEAPKRFMIAIADENANGLHFFMTAEEGEEFAVGILKTICAGHG